MWKDMEDIQLSFVRLSLRGNIVRNARAAETKQVTSYIYFHIHCTCKVAKNHFISSFAIQLLKFDMEVTKSVNRLKTLNILKIQHSVRTNK